MALKIVGEQEWVEAAKSFDATGQEHFYDKQHGTSGNATQKLRWDAVGALDVQSNDTSGSSSGVSTEATSFRFCLFASKALLHFRYLTSLSLRGCRLTDSSIREYLRESRSRTSHLVETKGGSVLRHLQVLLLSDNFFTSVELVSQFVETLVRSPTADDCNSGITTHASKTVSSCSSLTFLQIRGEKTSMAVPNNSSSSSSPVTDSLLVESARKVEGVYGGDYRHLLVCRFRSLIALDDLVVSDSEKYRAHLADGGLMVGHTTTAATTAVHLQGKKRNPVAQPTPRPPTRDGARSTTAVRHAPQTAVSRHSGRAALGTESQKGNRIASRALAGRRFQPYAASSRISPEDIQLRWHKGAVWTKSLRQQYLSIVSAAACIQRAFFQWKLRRQQQQQTRFTVAAQVTIVLEKEGPALLVRSDDAAVVTIVVEDTSAPQPMSPTREPSSGLFAEYVVEAAAVTTSSDARHDEVASPPDVQPQELRNHSPHKAASTVPRDDHDEAAQERQDIDDDYTKSQASDHGDETSTSSPSADFDERQDVVALVDASAPQAPPRALVVNVKDAEDESVGVGVELFVQEQKLLDGGQHSPPFHTTSSGADKRSETPFTPTTFLLPSPTSASAASRRATSLWGRREFRACLRLSLLLKRLVGRMIARRAAQSKAVSDSWQQQQRRDGLGATTTTRFAIVVPTRHVDNFVSSAFTNVERQLGAVVEQRPFLVSDLLFLRGILSKTDAIAPSTATPQMNDLSQPPEVVVRYVTMDMPFFLAPPAVARDDDSLSMTSGHLVLASLTTSSSDTATRPPPLTLVFVKNAQFVTRCLRRGYYYHQSTAKSQEEYCGPTVTLTEFTNIFAVCRLQRWFKRLLTMKQQRQSQEATDSTAGRGAATSSRGASMSRVQSQAMLKLSGPIAVAAQIAKWCGAQWRRILAARRVAFLKTMLKAERLHHMDQTGRGGRRILTGSTLLQLVTLAEQHKKNTSLREREEEEVLLQDGVNTAQSGTEGSLAPRTTSGGLASSCVVSLGPRCSLVPERRILQHALEIIAPQTSSQVMPQPALPQLDVAMKRGLLDRNGQEVVVVHTSLLHAMEASFASPSSSSSRSRNHTRPPPHDDAVDLSIAAALGGAQHIRFVASFPGQLYHEEVITIQTTTRTLAPQPSLSGEGSPEATTTDGQPHFLGEGGVMPPAASVVPSPPPPPPLSLSYGSLKDRVARSIEWEHLSQLHSQTSGNKASRRFRPRSKSSKFDGSLLASNSNSSGTGSGGGGRLSMSLSANHNNITNSSAPSLASSASHHMEEVAHLSPLDVLVRTMESLAKLHPEGYFVLEFPNAGKAHMRQLALLLTTYDETDGSFLCFDDESMARRCVASRRIERWWLRRQRSCGGGGETAVLVPCTATVEVHGNVAAEEGEGVLLCRKLQLFPAKPQQHVVIPHRKSAHRRGGRQKKSSSALTDSTNSDERLLFCSSTRPLALEVDFNNRRALQPTVQISSEDSQPTVLMRSMIVPSRPSSARAPRREYLLTTPAPAIGVRCSVRADQGETQDADNRDSVGLVVVGEEVVPTAPTHHNDDHPVAVSEAVKSDTLAISITTDPTFAEIQTVREAPEQSATCAIRATPRRPTSASVVVVQRPSTLHPAFPANEQDHKAALSLTAEVTRTSSVNATHPRRVSQGTNQMNGGAASSRHQRKHNELDRGTAESSCGERDYTSSSSCPPSVKSVALGGYQYPRVASVTASTIATSMAVPSEEDRRRKAEIQKRQEQTSSPRSLSRSARQFSNRQYDTAVQHLQSRAALAEDAERSAKLAIVEKVKRERSAARSAMEMRRLVATQPPTMLSRLR